jgi:hypothetical protein
MLANMSESSLWWFMEIPRTGTSTLERSLRQVFSEARAVYAKHWPVLPPPDFKSRSNSVVSVRNPYSRAVSCWQFFTVPGEQTFLDWLRERKSNSFFDTNIEARPQSFWLDLSDDWDFILRQEELQKDFWSFVHTLAPDVEPFNLHRYNDINGPWVNRVRKRTSRPNPWESYFCRESIDLVRELYSEDFKNLITIYDSEFPGELKCKGFSDAQDSVKEATP